MQKFRIQIAAIVVIVVIIVIFAVRYFVADETPTTENSTDISSNLECYGSAKFVAVQKGNGDSAGSSILIKYRKDPSQVLSCDYTIAKDDFEIKNDIPIYFLAFTDNFLALDSGTAPWPRGLIVLDLNSRKIVFTDKYSKPFSVKGDSITYLSETAQEPTVTNCPNLNDLRSKGLGAVLMNKVTVDLATLSKKSADSTACIATQ